MTEFPNNNSNSFSKNYSNDYSNDTIDSKLHEISTVLGLIHEQVKKTNGRVTCLESWRNRIIGAVAVITIVIVPVAVAVITRMIK